MALTTKDKNSNPTSVFYDPNKKTMAVSLPQDVILFQVITRVPTKSVIRFMCVSKQWKSFLMSGRFKEMHNCNLLKDPNLEDQNLFFYCEEEATFFTIDCESPPDNAPRSHHLPQFEASPPKYMSLLTSYHGLVCLGINTEQSYYYDSQYTDIILWNPLTTEYRRLYKPSNPEHIECYKYSGTRYGLYYNSCEDDYKLLAVTESCNVYIYSLKSDSWRKLNKKVPFQETDYYIPGFCWKKNIYFLFFNTARTSIRFNTTAERFHKIETPPGYDKINIPDSAAITVHKGSIHLCVKFNIFERTDLLKSTCIEMWKFDADGDIWSKVITYHFMTNSDICCLSPLHLMSNGNWLMRDNEDGGRICQVNLEKNKYTKDKDGHKSKGKNKSEGNCHDEYKLYYSDLKVGYPEQVGYTETFVSPNQYMKNHTL